LSHSGVYSSAGGRKNRGTRSEIAKATMANNGKEAENASFLTAKEKGRHEQETTNVVGKTFTKASLNKNTELIKRVRPEAEGGNSIETIIMRGRPHSTETRGR